METNYFAHCWGVFEGGGVRVAAHAGAYAAAKEAGVTFSRVAGTSGGSIVAALVAADATPTYLGIHLKILDFSTLLAAPVQKHSVFQESLPLWMRVLKPLTWGNIRRAANVATFAGLYGSQPLEDWLEERLLELVGPRREAGVTGPVQFSELSLPLHVVATDFTTGRPKVWSCESTPSDSVALAVRSSCSIPFFFQPVVQGTSVFVDGGVVSNLPTFVLNDVANSDAGRSVLSRILAFRLVEETGASRPIRNILDFGVLLGAAVIDSASSIQLSLQSNVFPIAIKTGKVKSTDFHGVGEKEKEQLHEQGAESVRTFIAHERLVALEGIATKTFRGFDEKMLLLVQQLQTCERAFISVGDSTYWLDHIFPSVLAIARRGVQMVVITTRAAANPAEQRRHWLLNQLGAEVKVLEGAVPFEGFAVDLNTEKAVAILGMIDPDDPMANKYANERVRLYTSDSDPVILQLLTEKLSPFWTESPVGQRKLPYRACAESKLFDRLRTVPMYARAKLRMMDVSVSDEILVMQHYVKEFKALQIRHHMSDLKKHKLDYFDLMEVSLPGGSGSIVTPPVLERVGERLVLIEGNTRLYHCSAHGIKFVRAVVVDDANGLLPSAGRQPLSRLKLVSSTTPLEQMYSDINRSLYRKIEEAVHTSHD